MNKRDRSFRNDLSVVIRAYHWQAVDGQLRRRWDNAAHYPEIPTHPHHIHENSEENVLPGKAMHVEEVLSLIAEEFNSEALL